MMSTGDGHEVYWETCGNPDGRPTVFLHGGPGSGCSVGQRRLFDPENRMAVLFDQRGCGRSRPLADDPSVSLDRNTTHHLIADMEQLRAMLGVEAWDVVGFSWGTTLALAYAQAHQERVSGMVLGLVTTTSASEVAWLTEGVGRIFPEQWNRFAAAVPEAYRRDRLIDSYAEMLGSDDSAVRDHAAMEWCAWEDAHVSLGPDAAPSPMFADPVFRYRFARLVTHYWRKAAFLEDEQLLLNAGLLNGIEGFLIHGRYDISSPLEVPWRLSEAWTTSTLNILEDAGHGSQDSFPDAVIESLSTLAKT